MGDGYEEAKQGISRVLRVRAVVVEQGESVWSRAGQREKDVLPRVVRVGREIDPSFAVVVEGIVQVQASRSGGDSDVSTVAPEDLFN